METVYELNKLNIENEKLKNICLEYELFQKSMVICLKEKDEIIAKYRSHKATIMKKVETMTNELNKKTRVIEKFRNEVSILKIENRNLKKELTQYPQKPKKLEYNDTTVITTRTEETELSHKYILGEIKTSYLEAKENKDSLKTQERKEVIKIITEPYSSYTCDICKRNYMSKKRIVKHIVRVHSEKKPYKCEFCSKEMLYSCSYREHLYRHIETDNSKVSEKFEQSTACLSYACHLCSIRTKSLYAYRRHIYHYHRDLRNEEIIRKKLSKQGFERNYSSYTCDICNKIFKKKCGLRCHIKGVHFEKIFKCDICEKEIKSIRKYRYHLHLVHNQQQGFYN